MQLRFSRFFIHYLVAIALAFTFSPSGYAGRKKVKGVNPLALLEKTGPKIKAKITPALRQKKVNDEIELLRNGNKGPGIRMDAISNLAKLSSSEFDDQIYQELIACLRDENPNIRRYAASALAEDKFKKYPDRFEKLDPLLTDRYAGVRTSILQVMAELLPLPPETISKIFNMALFDTSKRVRAAALIVLSRSNLSDPTLPAFEWRFSGWKYNEWKQRSPDQQELSPLESPEDSFYDQLSPLDKNTFKHLLMNLRQEDFSMRLNAVQAAGTLKAAGLDLTTALLTLTMNDRHYDVRQEALKSLRFIERAHPSLPPTLLAFLFKNPSLENRQSAATLLEFLFYKNTLPKLASDLAYALVQNQDFDLTAVAVQLDQIKPSFQNRRDIFIQLIRAAQLEDRVLAAVLLTNEWTGQEVSSHADESTERRSSFTDELDHYLRSNEIGQ